VIQDLSKGEVVTAEYLIQKYQYPNYEKNLFDTIQGLAKEEPQLPPLYFLMLRLWMPRFENSVIAARSLSVIFSILALASIYWLCIELFKLSLVGWAAVIILAVSPLNILYAQEARPYSFWTLAILLSCVSLLRALRLGNKFSWGFYAITLSLAVYSHLYSVFVLFGHAIYIIVNKPFRTRRVILSYLLASLAGIGTFVPWLWIFITNLSKAQETTKWLHKKVAPLHLVQSWLIDLSRVFVDLGFDADSKSLLKYLIIPISLLLFLLSAYSVYYLRQKTPKYIWSFVLILILIPFLLLGLPDLLFVGRRSTEARYLLPSYLGIQVAVSYLLSSQLFSSSISILRHQIWKLVLVIVISIGIASCAFSAQAEIWWNKGPGLTTCIVKAAHMINKTAQPLVILDSYTPAANLDLGSILSLSHALNPFVHLQLAGRLSVPKIPDTFQDVFIFKPSRKFRAELEKTKGYKLRDLSELNKELKENCLWKLVKE
jgi:uncharacterized membrane protein